MGCAVRCRHGEDKGEAQEKKTNLTVLTAARKNITDHVAPVGKTQNGQAAEDKHGGESLPQSLH